MYKRYLKRLGCLDFIQRQKPVFVSKRKISIISNNSSACTIILVFWNTLQVSLNVFFKLVIHVLFYLYCKCRYFLVNASLRNYVCIWRLVVIDVYTSVQIQKDKNLSNPSELYKFLQFQSGIDWWHSSATLIPLVQSWMYHKPWLLLPLTPANWNPH